MLQVRSRRTTHTLLAGWANELYSFCLVEILKAMTSTIHLNSMSTLRSFGKIRAFSRHLKDQTNTNSLTALNSEWLELGECLEKFELMFLFHSLQFSGSRKRGEASRLYTLRARYSTVSCLDIGHFRDQISSGQSEFSVSVAWAAFVLLLQDFLIKISPSFSLQHVRCGRSARRTTKVDTMLQWCNCNYLCDCMFQLQHGVTRRSNTK